MTRSSNYSKFERSRWKWGYIFALPTLIGVLFLNLIPLVQTLWLSFNKSGGFNKYKFVGLKNYAKLLADTTVWQSIGNTLIFAAITVPLIVFISLVLAALMNNKIKGIAAYRTVYFLPMIVAPAAIAMVWKWMFNADYGIINFLLSWFGVEKVRWLTSKATILFSVGMVGVWSQIGYRMIIIMAGLNSIPKTYYEAADIDGAGPVSKFFNITIPLVSPTLFFIVTTSIMNAIKQFDLVYMMIDETNPALQNGQTVLYLYFEEAFVKNNKGYASGIVMITFALIMVLTGIQFYLQKKWVHYE